MATIIDIKEEFRQRAENLYKEIVNRINGEDFQLKFENRKTMDLDEDIDELCKFVMVLPKDINGRSMQMHDSFIDFYFFDEFNKSTQVRIFSNGEISASE